jgi:alpha-beta hydrolase superfamily lysophospholipase
MVERAARLAPHFKTMNATLARADTVLAPAGVIDEPLYFPAGASRLFAWLHRHPGQSSDTGLVICKPFGYEGLCAHRSLRVFAQTAAASGVPSLCFDYAGTGDSMDIDPSTDQIEAWCDDVVSAVAELRQRTRVNRVCLLGFRFGALLASLAAQRTNVEALILAAPILNARSYLRELRMGQSMAASARRDQAALGKQASTAGTGAGDTFMEVAGYHLSAKTVARMEQIDLTALGAPPVSKLLVIDRSGVPAARAWTESVAATGLQAEYLTLSGFVEMMMTPPHFTRIPTEIVACVEQWLVRFAGLSSPSTLRFAGGLPVSGPSPAVLHLPGDERGGVAALNERPIRFGPSALLFGIVTEPCRSGPRNGAVVLLNAGADPHACVGRMYVSLARHWAQHGYSVLRMDLAGLGDSYPRAGQPPNEVFPPTALEDVAAAVELMRDFYGARDITLAGLCSGAYHSLRAAIAGLAVNRVLMINPQNYFWKAGRAISELRVDEVVQSAGMYHRRVWSAAAWRRLFSGETTLLRILRVYAYRVDMAFESCFREVARVCRLRITGDLGRELEDLTARGVALSFFFARGEPGIELLKMQAGSSLRRLGDRCKVHIIDGADHTFSHSASRAMLEPLLSEALLSGRPAAAAHAISR